MPYFDAVLFDFDGVLLDSEPVHCDCWIEALRPLGVPLTRESYAANCVGISDREMMRVFEGLSDPPADLARLRESHQRKKKMFRERMAVDPPFAPSIAEFLRTLAGKYKLGVVSTSAHYEIEPLLEMAGLRAYLDTIVGYEDTELHKPAPDPYLLAGGRLGTSRALALEDSAAGLASARAAGFEAVHIASPATLVATVRERLDRLR